MGVSQNWGYHFRGPNNKDYNILGSILGSPYFGKLPYPLIAEYTGTLLGFLIRLKLFSFTRFRDGVVDWHEATFRVV